MVRKTVTIPEGTQKRPNGRFFYVPYQQQLTSNIIEVQRFNPFINVFPCVPFVSPLCIIRPQKQPTIVLSLQFVGCFRIQDGKQAPAAATHKPHYGRMMPP